MRNLTASLSGTKKTWLQLTQFSIWIITIAGSFIVEPPLLKYGVSSTNEHLTKFIIAGITALAFIPLARKSTKSDYKFWLISAVFFFLLAVTNAFIYNNAVDKLSEKYTDEKRIVIGDNLLLEAKKFRDSVFKEERIKITDEDFIQRRIGMTDSIWPDHELKNNYNLLLTLYTACMIWITLFLLTVTQALYCFNLKTTQS